MVSSPWHLGRRRSSTASNSAWPPSFVPPPSSSDSTGDPWSTAASSTHPQRRRSSVVKRDLFAGGERDAVRCRSGGLEGLEEILALEPPPRRHAPVPPARRPSEPLFASTSMSSSASIMRLPAVPRRHSDQPLLSAPLVSPPLYPLAEPPHPPPSPVETRARKHSTAKGVKRKPVPRVALEEDDVDASGPRWIGAPAPPAGEPQRESAIEERVRRLSVDDAGKAVRGLGLRVDVGRGTEGGFVEGLGARSGRSGASSMLVRCCFAARTKPREWQYADTSLIRSRAASPASYPSPTSPHTSAAPLTAASTATSMSLSRSTTASSATTHSNVSSPRPFALLRRQPTRSASAHNVLFGGRSAHRSTDTDVDEALVVAWMDLIAGQDDEVTVRRRPSAVRAIASPPPSTPPAPQTLRGAPPALEPAMLAHLATALPPLRYSAASVPAPAPVSPADSADAHEPPAAALTSPSEPLWRPGLLASDLSPAHRVTQPRQPAETGTSVADRLSLLAPSLDDSEETTSDDYHSALDGSACSDLVDTPPVDPNATLRDRRLRKRSSSVLRTVALDPAAAEAVGPAPLSPVSPAQPEHKRRILSPRFANKPLPPRPPKSAARRTSMDAVGVLGVGRAAGQGQEGSVLGERGSDREVTGHVPCVSAFPPCSARLWC